MSECKGLLLLLLFDLFSFKFFSESINEKIHVIISGDAENWDKIQPPSLKKKKKHGKVGMASTYFKRIETI